MSELESEPEPESTTSGPDPVRETVLPSDDETKALLRGILAELKNLKSIEQPKEVLNGRSDGSAAASAGTVLEGEEGTGEVCGPPNVMSQLMDDNDRYPHLWKLVHS